MNKVKLAFIAIAILTAVSGAFATKTCDQCEHSKQYFYNGAGYVEVGEYGFDYDCYVTGGTCTYYRPEPVTQPNVYVPCRIGAYLPL